MLALLFPGQGSQRPGMGAPWQGHPSWRLVASLSEGSGADIAMLLVEADAETLRATANAQIAAFAMSLVILDAARGVGLDLDVVSAVAGHSLGEYTALVAAGVLTPEEGARLVAARGLAMQRAADSRPGTMAAVLGLEMGQIEDACSRLDEVWVANDNAPGQVVISGSVEGVEAGSDAAKHLGAKRVMALAVGGAFHSPLMAPAAAELEDALRRAELSRAAVPVVANVDAAAHSEGWEGLLGAQLIRPVRWRESLTTLAATGVSHFVELGPGTELSGMVKRTVEGAQRANVATPDDLAGLAGVVAGH